MFMEILRNVQDKAPRIHCITNFVTANDCANLLLACGASPIMAVEPEEVAEITAQCGGLTLNLGTPRRALLPAMLSAGKTANALGLPVVFDPVGVGASLFRREAAQALLKEVRFTVIRGNISELKALECGGQSATGVDAAEPDAVTPENLEQATALARCFAADTGAVIAITGTIDLVADAQRAYCIYNGHAAMRRVTGTGCQLSALTTAYAAANPQRPLEATAAAVCAMGLCGETAHARL